MIFVINFATIELRIKRIILLTFFFNQNEVLGIST